VQQLGRLFQQDVQIERAVSGRVQAWESFVWPELGATSQVRVSLGQAYNMEAKMSLSRSTVSVLWVALLITGILASVGLPQSSNAASLVQIRMTARKYTFDPDVIRVKEGAHVELIITATDRDHGIAIPAFGVKQYLKKGVPTTISFIASKAGTFPFRCSVFCGMGHRHMRGKLIVEAS
jgi:cytochrome c oxidase subunit II